MNIIKGKTFVPPSVSALVINASEGLVEIILPTADAINDYAARTGSLVSNIISYSIVGASELNAVRFYQGGDVVWSNGAKYIEFVSNVSGTINGQGGIWGFVESVPPFSGNLKYVSGVFSIKNSDVGGRIFVPTTNRISQVNIWGFKKDGAEAKSIFSQGFAAVVGSGYVNNVFGTRSSAKNQQTLYVPNRVVDFADTSTGSDNGWVGSIDEITADGFYINLQKVGEGLNADFNYIGS